MQEPEPRPSQDPHEEIELLREKLRRLEAEHAEVQQKLFDQYEWTREKTKAFDKELRSLRSISLEYKLLDFVRRVYQRTTGLPEKTLEEDVEKLKVSLAAIPAKNDPNADAWLRGLLRQTHANFELTIVIGDSDPEPAQDIKDSADVRVVRTKDEYSDAIRANIGLSFGSGDVWGVIEGGYWPYPRSVENVARFFAESRTSEVMLPVNVVRSRESLIVPTEYPHREDFFGLWKHYTGRHGCLFFRPEAYKKIGRINYEAGDAWLFGTLLQLAWHSSVGRPNSLIAVDASPASGAEERAKIEASNNWVRQHFYSLGFFNEYRKPVWYFPIEQSSPKSKSRRLEIERGFRRVRGILHRLQRGLYPPDVRLHFPAAAEQQSSGAGGAEVDLSRVAACPLTERLPDRFLFSLEPFDTVPIADVYYSSETSVAIVNRERVPAGAPGVLQPEWTSDQVDPLLRSAAWRFIRPVAFDGTNVAGSEVVEKVEDAEQVAGFQTAYEDAIASLLGDEKVPDTLWIGDERFSPRDSTEIRYGKRMAWDENPALTTVQFETLASSSFLAGRTAETGFDLIHLAGVLQFCQRPRHLLRFLACALKYDAPILVSTPNLDSSELRLLGPAWRHWDPQRTCFVYGAQSLRALMRHCGFEEKKLVSFSHPLGQQRSRRNLANAIPSGVPKSKSSGGQELRRSSSADLEGDFLIGIFHRKL